jgi:hypothetical protein
VILVSNREIGRNMLRGRRTPAISADDQSAAGSKAALNQRERHRKWAIDGIARRLKGLAVFRHLALGEE